jgi:FkbM family methyltransferase
MSNYDSILDMYTVENFKIYCIKNDFCITEYIKNNMLWEKWSEILIKECYIENTNMVDMGAHIGTTSLMMSKYISNNCLIYAFEPVYNFITNLNICENNLQDKIKLFNIGLSDKKENLEFEEIDFSVKRNYGFTVLDNLKKSDEKSLLTIEVDRFDNLNIHNISFMKIDVEGLESNVLYGAVETIKMYTPTIFIELWCTSENALKRIENDTLDYKNPLKCFSFLFNLGYICIPISFSSDDFLFIHHRRKDIIEKIMKLINK